MAAPPPPPLPLPPNPPAIALPAQPNDPNVQLPAAPVFPPTVNNVRTAVRYRRKVELSIAQGPLDACCTPKNHYDAILYEHSVVAQAAAAAGPQAAAPPWFQATIQQLRNDIMADTQHVIRAEILPDLRRLLNHGRAQGEGIVPFEIVPFTNGNDPTQPPHNLPPLLSINAIENLNGHNLEEYLQGYGAVPLPVGANPHATNRLQKETLKSLVGALL